MIRIGINGFGRIGRALLRAKFKYSEFEKIDVVAINDLSSPEMLAYLFKYDSVFGRLPYEVEVKKGYIKIEDKKIRTFQEPDPERIPWQEENVDYVIESTGKFTEGNLARKHLSKGVKRVIISAPAVNEDVTIVMGVNEEIYDPLKHFVISASSCISNSATPVLSLLMRYYEIEKCFLNSIHAYTNTQRLLDTIHPKDFRRARAAALNMVPVNIDFETIVKIIPTLRGKIEGICIRVPVPDASLNDFAILIKGKTTPVEINEIFRENQNRYLKYIEDPVVSTDIIGEPYSAIIDGLTTKVVDGNLIKVLAWYDNEWSYSVRILDLINFIAEKEV